MKFELEHVEGKIFLVVTIQIWGGDVTEKHDITEKFDSVLDDYVDFHFLEMLKKAKEIEQSKK